VKGGLLVVDVQNGSRAEDAGLAPGDIILEINRKQVNTISDFRSQYQNSKGQALLLVQRGSGTFLTVIPK
jgi:serine protease Do